MFNEVTFKDSADGLVGLSGKVEERLREVDEVAGALREAGLDELADRERIEAIVEDGGLWNWVDWFEMFGKAEYVAYDAGVPGGSGELFWGFVRAGSFDEVEGLSKKV